MYCIADSCCWTVHCVVLQTAVAGLYSVVLQTAVTGLYIVMYCIADSCCWTVHCVVLYCRQLLLDCGIGVTSCGGGGGGSSSVMESTIDADIPVVGEHRVLLFCQLKGMLDIVEKDLLK